MGALKTHCTIHKIAKILAGSGSFTLSILYFCEILSVNLGFFMSEIVAQAFSLCKRAGKIQLSLRKL